MPTNIVVPELGESVVEATVAKWLKKEGDRVSVGEPVVELETEKIDLEVGASQAGVLAKIAQRNITLPGSPVENAVLETTCLVTDGNCTAARAKYAIALAAPAGMAPDRLAEFEANREKAFAKAFPRCAP